MKNIGYIQVYTGNGKGKTTAALGLIFRALGAGFRIYIGQFMKGTEYSELNTAKKFSDMLTWERFGDERFICKTGKIDEKAKEMAQEGLKKAVGVMESGEYDIVILDEINVAMYFNLISVEDVLKLMDKKPKNTELILTGRYVPEEIIERADLVTEMKEIKHYYQKGVLARKGIEN